MADLVVGNDPALLRAHDAVFFLLAHKHLLHRFKQILLAHIFAPLLDRVDGSLVDHVRKIGTDRSAGRQRDRVKVHRLVHLHIFGMYL